MPESKPISVRLPDLTMSQLDDVCERLGCTRSQFVVESIEWALEREINSVHTPAIVQSAAMLIDQRGRVKMPANRVMPGRSGRIH